MYVVVGLLDASMQMATTILVLSVFKHFLFKAGSCVLVNLDCRFCGFHTFALSNFSQLVWSDLRLLE